MHVLMMPGVVRNGDSSCLEALTGDQMEEPDET